MNHGSNNRPASFRRHLQNRSLKNNLARLATVLVVGALGLYLLRTGHAATVPVSSEAENGSLAGDTGSVPDSSASGGRAVVFGSGMAPTDLQVFTGGNNIALVWNVPDQTVKDIQVWRNNAQIAVVAPSSSAPFQNGQLGKEYDDNNVTAGSTYQYKIRAVLTSGAVSAFTPTVTATQPKNTQPVPNITIDTSAAPSLSNYMNNDVVPLLHTWYPKVANEIAYPSYTPPKSYTIKMVDGLASQGIFCNTSSSGSEALISCDPTEVAQCAAAGQSCAAVFVHESTHVIQNGYPSDTTGWATEGLASWASDFFARQNINPYIPHPDDQLGGYTTGAYFINYIRTTYSQSFPKDLNIAQHGGTYTASLVPSETGGKSVNQIWQEMLNKYDQYAGTTGTVRNAAGKCLEVQNGTVANGTKLVLDTCNGSNAQKWAAFYTNAGHTGKFELISPALSSGSSITYCADDSFSSTANGTNIQYWGCDESNAQYWVSGANGSLVNQNSKTCLDTSGGSSVSGTQIIINTCNGSGSQNWSVP